MKHSITSILALGVVLSALTAMAGEGGQTLGYAKDEAVRLMGRVGLSKRVTVTEKPGLYVLSVGQDGKIPDLRAVKFDGFACNVYDGGAVIAAPTAKGVLNGVYTLAEEAGYAFVYPGEKGELKPEKPKALPRGERTVNPRFKYRGLFDSVGVMRFYDYKSWMEFLAKLRHNAYRDNTRQPESLALCRKLGFRPEVGGHGMRDCLPRQLFDKEPELFRMFMPEDFGGKRMKDSNFCISNPKTQLIVQENFAKMVEPYATNGYHAVHAWADDLPGNGWCMCSSCRSLEGTDQAQLAMNVEARAIRKAGYKMRVPAIAYHDTMFPSEAIDPDPLCFLVFAPRERCYGHALDDPKCARNAVYLKALKDWQRRYAKNDDAHTFEYYDDKLLFRGHTPYLPKVLVGDADTYEQHGIEAWMTLVVGGQLLAVDWNLLGFSCLAWEKLTPTQLTKRLTAAFPAAEREAWRGYLFGYGAAYERAFEICEQPYAIYMDYRWMPERGGEVGQTMIKRLHEGASMQFAVRELLASSLPKLGVQGVEIAKMEIARDQHQITDLKAMIEHQQALYEIAQWRNDGDDRHFAAIREHLGKACALVEQACEELRPLVVKSGEDDKTRGSKYTYYLAFAESWTIPEMKRKLALYTDK